MAKQVKNFFLQNSKIHVNKYNDLLIRMSELQMFELLSQIFVTINIDPVEKRVNLCVDLKIKKKSIMWILFASENKSSSAL